jgi:lipoyl(octanoyl) transferase
MIRVAADFGVGSRRVEGLTGTWTESGKLGAIGVRIHSGWITSHGFAFNVDNDLSLYDVIVPCGIRGKGVTSLARLLGRPLATAEVMDRFEARFREVFDAPGVEEEGVSVPTACAAAAPDGILASGARVSSAGRGA